MRKVKKYRHPSILETVHESAQGLYNVKLIDAKTMRKFDEMCLPKFNKKALDGNIIDHDLIEIKYE